jgi:hypothetical protein
MKPTAERSRVTARANFERDIASLHRAPDAVRGNPTHNPAQLINTGTELFVASSSRLSMLIFAQVLGERVDYVFD